MEGKTLLDFSTFKMAQGKREREEGVGGEFEKKTTLYALTKLKFVKKSTLYDLS